MSKVVTPNGIESDRSRYRVVGECLDWLLPSQCLREGRWLASTSIKYQGDSVLLVFKVSRGSEGPLVAFVGGRDLPHACQKVLKYLKDGGLKWKTDTWAVEKLTERQESV